MKKDIEDLEKYYMGEISKVIESDEFLKNLKDLEEYIKINYMKLRELTSEENKIKVGVERLIRFYFYTYFEVINIYPSPISSDMSIELEDVILNIDAKTINMITNAGDDKSIHFQKNQITFDNVPFFKQDVKGYLFGGTPFPSRMESFYKDKPVLTFFITVNYEDIPSDKKFKLTHYSLCCVPHKKIVTNEYNNNILENLKSWGYIGKKESETLGNQYKPLNKKDFNDNWIGFSVNGLSKINAWLDTSLPHPFDDIGGFCVRKLMDNKYKIVSYGISSRISKSKLVSRKDSEGNLWKGVYKIKISDID